MRRTLSIFNKCESCSHYMESSISDYLSKCAKFTYLDLKWDNIEYEFASDARRNESKCGKEAKEYIRKPFIDKF